MNKISDKAYNKKRKELLIKKDRNESVSNIDFGMYDLTPYMNQKESPTLFENIIFYENSLREIQHLPGKNASFTPEQEEALAFISNEKNEKIILSAPTSFGKTLIIKEYIYRYKPSTIVFIVPTNALAFELEESFKTNAAFNDFEIFDKCLDSLDEKHDEKKILFIGTQEKFQEIAINLQTIDLFVIDEAYKLKETTRKQRGYRLSEAFLKSISLKSKKIVLLSPNAEFIGFDKFGFTIFETEFNAVDRVFEQLDSKEFNAKLFDKIKKEKTILYFNSPDSISDFVNDVSFLPTKSDNFISMLEREFHPEWSTVKLLKRGILSHHGQMPKYVQNKMLKLFVENQSYNLLVGTNSISEGINTPTKNIFFSKNVTFDKDKLLFKNTIGRAGRLGQYPIGHIYSVSEFESIEKEKIKIELAISNEDEKNEIDETNSSTAIENFCTNNKISIDFYEKYIRSTGLSLSKINLIFEELKKDIPLQNPNNGLYFIPTMASNVFKDDYFGYKVNEDKTYIRGVLQSAYKGKNGDFIDIRSYEDRIQFFRAKFKDSEKYSDSKIIDGYIRFIYSTLEYYILPIMNVGKALKENYPYWGFGKNVTTVITDFFRRYYDMIVGYDFSSLPQDYLKIVSVLKEYGISIKKFKLDAKIIKEISESLNKRFSTFDVINAIKKLARSQSSNAKLYSDVIDYYSL